MSDDRFRMNIQSISSIGAKGVKIVGELEAGQAIVGNYVRVWTNRGSAYPTRLSKQAKIIDKDHNINAKGLTTVYVDNRDFLKIKQQDHLLLVAMDSREIENLDKKFQFRIEDAFTIKHYSGRLRHILILGQVEYGNLNLGTPLRLIDSNEKHFTLTKYKLLSNQNEWIDYAEVGDWLCVSQFDISGDDARKMDYIVTDAEAIHIE